MKPYVVVDASVSLKWALDDEDAIDQAVALRDAAMAGQFEMVAPSLWLYEMINGLVTAVRRARLEPQAGIEALNDLMFVGVRLADPEAEDIYRQSIQYGIAAYDAAYLALADALDASLWTGDRRFYQSVQGSASRAHWIGDFPV